MDQQPHNDETMAVLRDLRERIFALMEGHEAAEHHGGACLGNRTSLIAWLCHSIGVRDFEKLAILVDEYDTEHERLHGPGIPITKRSLLKDQ